MKIEIGSYFIDGCEDDSKSDGVVMAENGYFYNGVPLTKYCKDNNINVRTIRIRIWKKKHSKKYENYTEQEIINMVVESCGTGVKYMYKGTSLRQYCLNNGINIRTVNSRIDNLKKKNKNLSNDELVILAMEEFNNQNFKYFYHGIPLKEYCESHSEEINYNAIIAYINCKKEKNSELSNEELIEQYLNKEHKGIYKYYYLGIPLKQYCDENNISYKNVIKYISRYKNTDVFIGLSDDELVEAIMEKYQPFVLKYLYKGLTLREYCIQNDLSYYSVVSFVKRKLANGSTKSIDVLIDEGIKTINRYGIIYYYMGIPLKDYAKQNGLNVGSIRSAILRKQLKSNKPLQEIINECVETYQKFSIKYYYNGVPLLTYCNSIGLNYNTVIQRYLYEYVDKMDVTIDEAIKQIIDYYKKYPPVRTKYYFEGQSLAKFCNAKGYSYLAVWRRIKTLEAKNDLLNVEEIIISAIKKYEDRLYINKINEIFDKLKGGKIRNIDEIKDICNFLKIDFTNVVDLIDMDFSYNQAINMIWYFSDKKVDNDVKIITDKKIKDIFLLITNLKNSKIDINQIELYDLVGIYKSELYDTRNEILLKQKKYIYKIINFLCNSYEVKINNSNLEDFESEIKYYILIVIDKINLNVYGQLLKYMDLTVKGYFRIYLKKYKEQNNSLSLDKVEYFWNEDAHDNLGSMSFGPSMMEILASLSTEDLSFIMLKYLENYSDEELANYYNLTLEELKQKEMEILSLLKNNDNVKKLKK